MENGEWKKGRGIYGLSLLVLGGLIWRLGGIWAEEPFGLQVPVPLNGDGATTALLERGTAGTEFEVTGTFHCDYDGKDYDALYTTDSAGRWGEPHGFFLWPPGLEPVNRAFNPSHTYRFRVQPGYDFTGQGITFRIDVDGFVNRYLITPAEVRASLQPGAVPLAVRAVEAAGPMGAPVRPWGRLAAPVGIALLLMLGAAAWRHRRLQQKLGLDTDLGDLLQRIQRKHERLRAVLDDPQADYAGLRQGFMRLAEGAQALAGHVQTFRRLERQVDRGALAEEIVDLDRRRAEARDPAQVRDLEAALAEKRKVLALLERTARNQDRYLARLSKVEALLDASQLQVVNLQVAAQDTVLEDRIMDDIAEELEILEETVEEVQQMWPEMEADMVRLREG